MSDGQVAVTVRNIRRQPANLAISVDDDGYLVFQPPAPGTFAADPELDLPELQNMLELLGQHALRKRRR